MAHHLDPQSLDSFAEQLSETPSTLPSFFEVVGVVGALFADVRRHGTDDNKWFWLALKLYDEWIAAHPDYWMDCA